MVVMLELLMSKCMYPVCFSEDTVNVYILAVGFANY